MVWHVAHCFDVIAIGVAYEGSEILGVVLRPEARSVKNRGSLPHRGIEERHDLGSSARGESHVALPKSLTRLQGSDPELRLGFATESHDRAKFHDALSAQGGEDGIVESRARRHVTTLQGKMI